MNNVHEIFQPMLQHISGKGAAPKAARPVSKSGGEVTAPRLQRFMVQVWDHSRAPGAREFNKGAWTDYWPTEAESIEAARKKAREQVLAPFWRAKRWRVIQK